MDDNGRQAIAHNVALTIEKLGPLSDLDFGLNEESVAWVDGYIERQRARPDFDLAEAGTLVAVLGSFLGECVAANAGGSWHQTEDGTWCVLLPGGNQAFPFAKVRKQFQDGNEAGESIASFYRVAVDFVAKGKLNG